MKLGYRITGWTVSLLAEYLDTNTVVPSSYVHCVAVSDDWISLETLRYVCATAFVIRDGLRLTLAIMDRISAIGRLSVRNRFK